MNNLHGLHETAGSDGGLAVTSVVKQSGKVSGYQLSNGQIVDKAQGVEMAKNNQISGVSISSRNGREYLRSLPDGAEGNNLGSLPTVRQ